MKMQFIAGRDFRPNDTFPGSAIINETFAKTYFNGENPIGHFLAKGQSRCEVVGVVADAPYRSLREQILPVAYVPIHSVDASGGLRSVGDETFIVRTSISDPRSLTATMRQEVQHTGLGMRVTNVTTQMEINQSHTVRERLMATLASFFAVVALLLAGIGLYGVLHYSVLQRRREIGIRIALGARIGDIARGVTLGVYSMVLVGAVTGLGLGMITARYIDSLFYQVKSTDLRVLVIPSVAILAAALLAALPPVIRATRIDPIKMLRSE